MPVDRSIDVPESLRGADPEEVVRLIPAHWHESSSRRGGGRRFANPDKIGEQIRIMPGNPADPSIIKRGPYVIISRDGIKWRIPLKNNPAIPR